MKKIKVFLVLLGLLLHSATVFAQSVPYHASNATGSSPISPDNRIWSGSGSSTDPWYNNFLNGAIELFVARGNNLIGCYVKNNLSYAIRVRVRIQSQNGKTGFVTISPISANNYSSQYKFLSYTDLKNSDGFSGAQIIVLRTQDQNGKSYYTPDSFNKRTW